VIRCRVCAYEQKEIRPAQILQFYRSGASADGALERNAGGLVTIKGAVADIVGAVKTGK
jgi:hypothetical protein